jgi:hypothetical protein
VVPRAHRDRWLDDQGLALILRCASGAWCGFRKPFQVLKPTQSQMLRRRSILVPSDPEAITCTNVTAHYSILSAMLALPTLALWGSLRSLRRLTPTRIIHFSACKPVRKHRAANLYSTSTAAWHPISTRRVRYKRAAHGAYERMRARACSKGTDFRFHYHA